MNIGTVCGKVISDLCKFQKVVGKVLSIMCSCYSYVFYDNCTYNINTNSDITTCIIHHDHC